MAEGAVHDPGETLRDVAPAVGLGGDCLPVVGMLRADPTGNNTKSWKDVRP